jgi:hypothetical protein
LYTAAVVNAVHKKKSITSTVPAQPQTDTAIQQQLICANAIVALGRLAVGLHASVLDVAENVLSILQQRFCQPPSPLDALIVGQLADMLIGGCASIYADVMKMFTTIVVESSSGQYGVVTSGGPLHGGGEPMNSVQQPVQQQHYYRLVG